MKINKFRFSVILILILLSGCKGDVERVSRTLLGTVVTVTIADSGDNVQAFNAAFSEIEKVQKAFSLYEPDSEISRMNSGASLHPVSVSRELFDVINFSMDISAKTGGAFDITWASAGRIWDFSDPERFTPPADEKIKGILPLISYKNVKLDVAAGTVRFLKNGTRIGLGGVAKGYAVKKAVISLKGSGVKGAIVACAGDIQVIGNNNGKPWLAGIQDPRGSSVIATFGMHDGDSVSTSGDYERFRIINGRRYHHIIDPVTGYPADSGLISATVFSRDPMVSDACSTAFFVSGLERAKNILSSMNGVSAVLVDQAMNVYASSDLKGKVEFRRDLKVTFF